MKLTEENIVELAKPFVNMVHMIEAFYKDPKNKEAYEKWLKERTV